MFSRGTGEKDLQKLATSATAMQNTDLPGRNCSTFHFEIKSNLGWIAWKDREAALYMLFERAFLATRCELKINDSLDALACEIEMPNDQEVSVSVSKQRQSKFLKEVKSKTLSREIDKLHGIEPALCSWSDCKISNITKSGGSTNVHSPERSSVDTIRRRIENLERCSAQRTKEVSAIKDMAASIKEEMGKRFDALCHQIDMKVYERCGSKFDTAEYSIMKVLREELSFLATPVNGFKHPPDGIQKTDSGAQAFLAALQKTYTASKAVSPHMATVLPNSENTESPGSDSAIPAHTPEANTATPAASQVESTATKPESKRSLPPALEMNDTNHNFAL
ncbi:hypothetical protein HDV03_001090 [Kappamyces sp. JEL0829]|nr:hypothetical protein HDV03_001090 [Kappamyces sp. JEL0829]